MGIKNHLTFIPTIRSGNEGGHVGIRQSGHSCIATKPSVTA